MRDSIYTIGFTKKTAEHFFSLLTDNNVKKIIDVRLYPSTQLAGFSKSHDLAYFLKTIAGIAYEHRLEFAPTDDLLKGYKDGKVKWREYEVRYLNNLKSQMLLLIGEELKDSCLLCAEDTPEQCHRRLLAEYLAGKFNMQVKHL